VLAAGLVAGLGGWIGVGGRGGVGALDMLRTGLNTALPGLVVLGLGALLYGLVPRVAAPLLYGYVLWAFVVEIFGSTVAHARWLARTSVLEHLGPVPATDPDWPVIGVLLALSLVAAGIGVLAFERRDVQLG
jgi:ABC-2 type transport system permease protein